MLKLCVTLARVSRTGIVSQATLRLNNFSSALPTAARNVESDSAPSEAAEKQGTDNQGALGKNGAPLNMTFTNTMVAAAFASLKSDSKSSDPEISTPLTDRRITNATTIDQLLSISDGTGVSRRHALKVSMLVSNINIECLQAKTISSYIFFPKNFLKLCMNLIFVSFSKNVSLVSAWFAYRTLLVNRK